MVKHVFLAISMYEYAWGPGILGDYEFIYLCRDGVPIPTQYRFQIYPDSDGYTKQLCSKEYCGWFTFWPDLCPTGPFLTGSMSYLPFFWPDLYPTGLFFTGSISYRLPVHFWPDLYPTGTLHFNLIFFYWNFCALPYITAILFLSGCENLSGPGALDAALFLPAASHHADRLR